MSNFYLKNMRNQRELKNETNLYLVEPIVGTTPSWMDLPDVTKTEKAIPLHFQELKGKKLYAKFIREGDKSFWKLFIVDNTTVSILYIETGALNPIGNYKS